MDKNPFVILSVFNPRRALLKGTKFNSLPYIYKPPKCAVDYKMKRILLVEDNENNRDMLSRRLIKKGFLVEMAVNGQEAIDLADQLKPDLILMDMSLPILDGWEATKRLKASENKGIPVIALTAHAMSGDRQKALEAGCDDYETKPVDLTKLLDKINNFLK